MKRAIDRVNTEQLYNFLVEWTGCKQFSSPILLQLSNFILQLTVFEFFSKP